MTKRFIQLELASRNARAFAAGTAKWNRAAAETARAQREAHLSPLAIAYRVRARAGHA